MDFFVSIFDEESSGENAGIVVYDIPNTIDTTADDFWTVDYNNNGYPDVQEDYNQFVWVPVETAYVTQSSLQTLIDDNTKPDITDEKSALQSLVNNGIYPMTVQYEVIEGTETVTNYRGVLYDFSTGDSGIVLTVKDFSTTDDYVNTATYDREPAHLKELIAQTNNSIGLTQTDLQTEYNNMVDSVARKGGFYVARYEFSYNSSIEKGESKRGKTVTYNTNFPKRWFDMYDKSRKMYELEKIKSQMITGAQYDQIMIWMKELKNINDNTKYYIMRGNGMGNNYSANSHTPVVSGYNDEYSAKNVFDLYGNYYEFTSEAYGDSMRRGRGGSYYFNMFIMPIDRRAYRIGDGNVAFTSRVSLIIY